MVKDHESCEAIKDRGDAWRQSRTAVAKGGQEPLLEELRMIVHNLGLWSLFDYFSLTPNATILYMDITTMHSSGYFTMLPTWVSLFLSTSHKLSKESNACKVFMLMVSL
ncbi:hypothetical protein FEM48_Zijuj02G0138800 [Ziziphus jujuba var. spinosa]|uniref:Uncharacterized protein n=1 Tax=Ziziphus jujuba var. spinosa TaxID=714518 RepID=A0A978VW29_ZIZJJ|nr:hypothetical protein FEM48_Zijuj02G0138800 [Ziziphus jujuba var. spinosa]